MRVGIATDHARRDVLIGVAAMVAATALPNGHDSIQC
jgi:hypothetical protein